MQIIGFNFTNIKAEKTKDIKGKLEIKSNIEILNIKKENIELVKDKEVLKFDFNFTIKYSPDFGEVDFKGFVLGIVEESKMKETLKSWKKKKIPEEIRIHLFNLILTKSNLKALQLEEELNLPNHIPLPKIQPKEQQNTNYAG